MFSLCKHHGKVSFFFSLNSFQNKKNIGNLKYEHHDGRATAYRQKYRKLLSV